MKIPSNVRVLPFPFDRIYKGCALNNTIFIRKSIIEDLKTDDPDPESVGVLLHESEHIKRMKQQGKIKYALKFWILPNFRFQEEIAANIPQMKYIKEHGSKYDIYRRARHLSGPIYLWCMSYDKAKSTLSEIWKGL